MLAVATNVVMIDGKPDMCLTKLLCRLSTYLLKISLM